MKTTPLVFSVFLYLSFLLFASPSAIARQSDQEATQQNLPDQDIEGKKSSAIISPTPIIKYIHSSLGYPFYNFSHKLRNGEAGILWLFVQTIPKESK